MCVAIIYYINFKMFMSSSTISNVCNVSMFTDDKDIDSDGSLEDASSDIR